MGSIKTNSIVYMIRTLMNVLFPLITFKYASNVIMANGIGAANFSSAVIGYVALISSLGISTYAISEGAKLRRNNKDFNIFVREIFTINLVSMLLSYCVLIFLLFAIDFLMPYRILILIYSSTIFFGVIGIEWFFVIEEQFGYITIRSIIFQILSLALLFVFVRNKSDVAIYVALTAICSAGSGILNFMYAQKTLKITVVSLSLCKKHMKPILIIWAANIASLIYVNADTIIIGLLRGDYAVGYYAVAVKIVKAVCIPIASISIVAGPQLAEAISEHKSERINQIIEHVINFMSFFIFPSIMFLFIFGKETFLIISDESFLSGLHSERVLLLDIFLSPINGFIVNQIMVPIKKEKETMVIMIIAATINIIFDFLFIGSIGIIGAALATIISEAIVLIFCLPHLLKTVNIKVVMKNAWKYMLASFIIIPIYYACSLFFQNSWFIMASTVSISIMLYTALIYKLMHKQTISIKYF